MRAKIKFYYGFTLVELLVVISIIALLLSIMMPALSRARGQAKKVVCSSRVKQHALGLSMYISENKGYLPPPLAPGPNPWIIAGGTAYWQTQIANYVVGKNALATSNMPDGPMWLCPEQTVVNKKRIGCNWYATNSNLCTWNNTTVNPKADTVTPYKLMNIKQPATILYETDAVEHIVSYDYSGANWSYPYYRSGGKSMGRVNDARHLGRENILWLDMHVSTLSEKEFMGNFSLWVPRQ